MFYITLLAILVALETLSPNACADVKLPAIISDHMVLQGGINAPVWGWAEPGEEIKVTIAGQAKKTVAGKDGKWLVKLDPLKAGDPTTLTVTGKNTLTINDVLVGDVWICTGQSNMRMTVDDSKDFPQEQAAANFPKIRHFKEVSGLAATPQEQCSGEWLVCTPDTVGGFSAAGYFFGREIHQKTGIPIGLITSSMGNSTIAAWTSREALVQVPEFKKRVEDSEHYQANWDSAKAHAADLAAWQTVAAKAQAEGKPAPPQPGKPVPPCLQVGFPASSFNGKLAPLIPYALRGGLWYQGECDTGSLNYDLQLAMLIQDWRTRWGYDFPFAWVQLPECGDPQTVPVEENSGWARLRSLMTQALKIPKTGMAIGLGTGEAHNIHPKNKQEVGRRLALWALATVYGQKNVAWAGPLLAGDNINGSDVALSFTHTDGGLVAKGGDLKGFAIAGADKKWLWANAKIVGDTVVVSHPDVKAPVAVRYAWAGNPAGANLYNGAGLPASTFRTDTP